jgi:nitrile hydratase beta subunit
MKPHHDMGGDHYGPIEPDHPNDPVFETPWHKRVLGLTVAGGAMGAWNIDASRFWRETLPKDDYHSFSYYEKWLAALTNLFVAKGFVTRDEIAAGSYDGPQKNLRDGVLRAAAVPLMLATGAKASRPAMAEPLFRRGQKVRTRLPDDTKMQMPGHTRLPHYAADKIGTILFSHGYHVLPNSNAHFLGECPEPLYSVEFSSADLWADGNGGDKVVVDCWQSYLVPSE